MPGGTLQLSAYGSKNYYFNGNPQLTFFKSIYKRHTNFAIEQIEIDSNSKLSFGNKTSYDIGADGELLINLYLLVKLDLTFDNNINDSFTYNLGNNIINEYNIQIGNKIIDRQYGTWLQILDELTEDNCSLSNGKYNFDNGSGSDVSVGNLYTKNQHIKGIGIQKNHTTFNNTNNNGGSCFFTNGDNNRILGNLYINFPLWFTKNLGLSLPLFIIKDKVKFYLVINPIKNSIDINGYKKTSMIQRTSGRFINNLGIESDDSLTLTNDNTEFKLYGEFIFLDDTEKMLIRNKEHEYIIEQLQHTNYTLNSNNNSVFNDTLELKYNYCVKELIWAFHRKNKLFHTEILSLMDHNGTIGLYFNGEQRFNDQNVLYFTRYQPFKYHTGGSVSSPDSIFVYSFALFPENNEPSGVCNFSVIDNIQLKFNNVQLATDVSDHINGVDLSMFAIHYNIMEIRDGQVDVLFKPTL